MTGRHGRRYYLRDVPLDEAIDSFQAALRQADFADRIESESVDIRDALGRTTAAPVWAVRSVPHYDAAAMDGIAVRSTDTVGASETSPLTLRVPDQASWVDTGDPMPEGMDAVIMIEVVREIDDSTVEIRSPVPPYNHVRPLGEDIVAAELLLPENHVLRPVDLGACAAAGVTRIDVRRKPKVAILPTGSELVTITSDPGPGDIVEFNSLVLAGMLSQWGAAPTPLSPVPDDPVMLEEALLQAVERFDVVLVNAGSSAGTEDYTAGMVEKLGSLVVHGVAIRPGHPIVLGVVRDRPVIGIPGYPVSAVVAAELFVQPLIQTMLGSPGQTRATTDATMTRRIQSPMGEDEYLRVGLGQVGDRLVATPLQRGAGVISSLVRADGIVTIPRFSEGIEAGSTVNVALLRPLEDIHRTVVSIGSHDLVLDLIASRLSSERDGPVLSCANVGSLGGLIAVNRGEAHMAGCHLLDEESGVYNVSYIRRYVRGRRVALVHLAARSQGLIVQRGNPLRIMSLEDLTRPEVRFVNRQRGSGTRVLLDYELGKAGLDERSITGYHREEYTHLAIAAAVDGDRADAGMGILSAARAMDLEFVPLLQEDYDLAIPVEFYEDDLLATVLTLIRSPGFQREVEALGGYDVRNMGNLKAVIGSGGE